MAQMPAGVDLGQTTGWMPEPEVPGFADMFNQNVRDAQRVSNFNAHSANIELAMDEIADKVKTATGIVVPNPSRQIAGSDPMSLWRDSISAARVKAPDALDWDAILAEPEKRAWSIMKETRDKTNKMMEGGDLIQARDTPLAGVPILGSALAFAANAVTSPKLTAAQVAGSLVGQLNSPLDTAANFIGLTTPGANSLLKAAVKNAVANAGVQAVLSGIKQEDYRKAGLPAGWNVWLEEVEGAAATGFALDMGIRGPARALTTRYGRDTAPGTFLSKNTPKGGFALDAIETVEVAPLPSRTAPPVQIDPETIKKVEAGDIAATREVLEKTGVIDTNPGIRFALEHVESGGKLTEEAVIALEQMGVARPDGYAILADAIAGRMPVMPDPVPTAVTPLAPDRGADVLARAGEDIDAMPEAIAAGVRDGLEVGIPRIIEAVEAVANDPPNVAAQRLAEVLDDRTVAEVQLHAGRSGPVEVARTLREHPDLMDSNVPIDVPDVAVGRALARLEPEAFDAVARGDVPPEIGAAIANQVSPEHQARMVADLAMAEPKTIESARSLIDELTPVRTPEGPPLDGGMRLDDPNGPEAKAQIEALERETGADYDDAMAPIQARDRLEAEIETKKGQIVQLEEAASRLEDADVAALAAARAELRDMEAELVKTQMEIDPDGSGKVLAEMALRAIEIKREADVTAAINEALAFGRRILPGDVRIDVRPDEEMVFRAASGELAQLDGLMDVDSGHIKIAVHALNLRGTLGHEAIHVLVRRGLLTEQEVSILAGLAREAGTFSPEKEAEYRQAYEARENLSGLIDEEAAASYIEARIAGKIDGPENATIARIAQFFERVRNVLRGYGFTSGNDVVNAVLSGQAARREAKQLQSGRSDETSTIGDTASPISQAAKGAVEAEGQPLFAIGGGLPRDGAVAQKSFDPSTLKRYDLRSFEDEISSRIPTEPRDVGDYSLVAYTRGGYTTYDLVPKGETSAYDKAGNSISLGRFAVKPGQNGGVEVTNSNIMSSLQRQGLGSKVYSIIEADIAPDVLMPSPWNQLSLLAVSFWAKRSPEKLAWTRQQQVESYEGDLYKDRVIPSYPQSGGEGQSLLSLRGGIQRDGEVDGARRSSPEPPIRADMAEVDRFNRMRDLIEACRA